MICETPDFIFPLTANIYYPIVEQDAFGDVKKQWVLDKIVACNFSPAGTAGKEEIIPNANISQEKILVGRTRSDIRISSKDSSTAMINVLISDICDSNGNKIYIETAGVRKGKSTIFEIASQEPIVGPFGSVEYFKVVIRRSENQAADV